MVAFNFYLFVVYSFCFFRIICALFITAASTYYVTRDEQIILLIYNAIYSVVFLRRQFACFFVFAGDRRDPLVERNSLRGPQITVFILAFNCEKENFSIVIEKHTKKRDCFVRAMEKRARFPKCFLCCLFVD